MNGPNFFILFMIAGILALGLAAFMLTGAVWLFLGWRKKTRSVQFLSALPFGVGALMVAPLLLLVLLFTGFCLIAGGRGGRAHPASAEVGILWFALLELAVITANVVGLTSVVVSFTKLRHGSFALVCALVSVVSGVPFLFPLIETPSPSGFGTVVYVVSSTPLIFGAVGLGRWLRLKTCPRCHRLVGLSLQFGVVRSAVCAQCKTVLIPSHSQRLLLALGSLMGVLFLLRGGALVASFTQRLCYAVIAFVCAFGLVSGPRLRDESDVA